jgi:hypothetical protein
MKMKLTIENFKITKKMGIFVTIDKKNFLCKSPTDFLNCLLTEMHQKETKPQNKVFASTWMKSFWCNKVSKMQKDIIKQLNGGKYMKCSQIAKAIHHLYPKYNKIQIQNRIYKSCLYLVKRGFICSIGHPRKFYIPKKQKKNMIKETYQDECPYGKKEEVNCAVCSYRKGKKCYA